MYAIRRGKTDTLNMDERKHSPCTALQGIVTVPLYRHFYIVVLSYPISVRDNLIISISGVFMPSPLVFAASNLGYLSEVSLLLQQNFNV
jgi:hypothetical protein